MSEDVMGGALRSLGRSGGQKDIFAMVRNDFVFTTAFLEGCLWFWVYVLLRDERAKLAAKIEDRRKLELEML